MKAYPDDWRVRVTAAVAVAICMGAAMILGPAVGIEGLLPGGLAIIAAIVIGILVGNLVGRRLFGRPPAGPDDPPRA